MACVWATALGTGCRRGELSGFSVESLRRARYGDDSAWSLRVSRSAAEVGGALVLKEPKSATSKRNVALDDATFEALSGMLARRSALLGPPAPSAPLFVDAMGERIAPGRMSREFSALCRRLKLAQGVHLHTLRHTHATYLLEAGESIRAVQERLGHSSVKTTLELYGHVLPGRDLEAARLFAKATESSQAMPWER
ncbi:site-specific integrase [Slackia exigua]